METIHLAGIKLQFDRERTAAILEGNSNSDWCQCDGCTNKRVTTRHFLPEEVVDLLSIVGVDADHAFHREGKRRREKKPGWYRTVAYWPISGILDGRDSVELAPDVFLAVGPAFSQGYSASRILEDTGLDTEPNLLFLRIEMLIPWIVDDLCELRYESHCPPCRKCRYSWRWTAYLKRGSRLPEWYGMPEMAAVFRRPKTRVLVSICFDCGDLTFEAVPDKPPFRRKSEATKLEKRQQRESLKRYRARWAQANSVVE